MLRRPSVSLLLSLFCCTNAFADAVASDVLPDAIMPAHQFDMIDLYCIDCHGSGIEEGSINLEELSFNISDDIKTAEIWQKVLNALNSGEMPPEDELQVTDAEKVSFLDDLSNQLVTARQILSDSGGVITLRRLNRREYENTLEDLLGIAPDISDLPDDQLNSGFDTAGASLFFSSDQLEQYLNTARQTLELVLLPRREAKFETTRIEPEEFYNPHYAKALAGFIDIRQRSRDFLAQKTKPASDYGLVDEYQAKKQKDQEWLPLLSHYLEQPENKTGATLIMTIKQGGPTKVKLPTLGESQQGKYTIRVRAAAFPDVEDRFHYLEFTSGFGTGRELLGWRKVTAPLSSPEIIEFSYEHKAGEKKQVWIHQRTHQDRGDKNLAARDQKANGRGTPPGLWVDWAEIEGPKSTGKLAAAADKILFARPLGMSKADYPKAVLQRFASRAFRGETPSDDFLDRLHSQYTANLAKGMPQNEALIGPLAIILSSPSFLYMVESTGNEASPQLTGPELAVRLAYFLWSAPPDAELMELANRGKLTDPRVLSTQTSRLLADPRAIRFVRDFTYQWLEMVRLDTFQFHGLQFPRFDNAVRENAREEIFETMRLLLAERLPLQSFLKADFVVINDLLAGYYGIPDIKGHQFRKVALPDNSLRGGLLGTAAVLAMGSDGVRSSPVERGAWVLRHLLHRPPPPAPPNVPQLGRLAGEALGARELQRAHMEEPQCAQCHNKIDPVGFGLENFDASGQWRDVETVSIGPRNKAKITEFPIDPSGKLPGGDEFTDYFGLRDAVAERPDAFARAFAEALITYGLGRPFGFVDQNLADAMIEAARPGNYDPNLFIHALIQSPTFQSK